MVVLVGVLPPKLISFHCSENESNERETRNLEVTRDFTGRPQGRAAETVVVKET